jgi:tryptophan synthase alpha chain
MTYFNLVFHFGVDRFVKEASAAGVDGVIIPDLPPDEAGSLMKASRKSGFANIFLLTPTSAKERIKIVSRASSGFIYYVSLTGVTGVRVKLPQEIKNKIKGIKKFTDKPVCVGFGVSGPRQAKEMSKISDGVIVGSAVINIMHKNLGKSDLVKKVAKFIRSLSRAIRQK